MACGSHSVQSALVQAHEIETRPPIAALQPELRMESVWKEIVPDLRSDKHMPPYVLLFSKDTSFPVNKTSGV